MQHVCEARAPTTAVATAKLHPHKQQNTSLIIRDPPPAPRQLTDQPRGTRGGGRGGTGGKTGLMVKTTENNSLTFNHHSLCPPLLLLQSSALQGAKTNR